MKIIKTLEKASQENRQLFVDYECWLAEGNSLIAFQAAIQPLTVPPLTVSMAFTEPATKRKLTMFVAGGLGNNQYAISLIVTTASGAIKRDDIGMRVTP